MKECRRRFQLYLWVLVLVCVRVQPGAQVPGSPVQPSAPAEAAANADKLDESAVPLALMPSEPEQPDATYERGQVTDRVRGAIASLPAREQRVIAMYYYEEATMKQIGAEIGVNESRVSQLHARAIRRLRDALGSSVPQADAAQVLRSAILEFEQKGKASRVTLASQVRAAAA